MKNAAMSRRDFLKTMGVTAAAVSMTGLLGSCSEIIDGSDSIPDTPSTANILWTIRENGDGTARLVGYDKEAARPSGFVAIPEVVNENTIVAVSVSFVGCDELVRVSVPATVKVIEKIYSPSMRVLDLSEGVETIEKNAFSYCTSLESVSLPQSVKVIEDGAFHTCRKLTSVSFPQSMERIGANAFEGTKLQEVVLPSDAEVNYGAFYNVSTLERVVINSNASFYCASGYNGVFEGCSRLKNVVFNSSTNEIGARMFASCTALSSITLPDGVLKIGEYAFQKCSALKSLQIPLTVTEIGDFAFAQCTALASVSGMYGSTVVGIGLFRGCASLTKYEIPVGAASIPEQTFDGCTKLRKIYIPYSVKTIESAFDQCGKLKDIYYQGTANDWSAVSIASSGEGEGNAVLSKASLHPNTDPGTM